MISFSPGAVNAVLADSGPLVALLDRSDPHHIACQAALRSIPVPLFTVMPALTEAMYLLSFSRKTQQALLEMVSTRRLRLLPVDEEDIPRIRDLMDKYRDLPMDFADAALVRVAERERLTRVFTIDRRDFSLYRPAGIGSFRLIP